jgi:hypothetical protein
MTDSTGYLIGTIMKGGPGSGNFGHVGRPGMVGGSGEGGGSAGAKPKDAIKNSEGKTAGNGLVGLAPKLTIKPTDTPEVIESKKLSLKAEEATFLAGEAMGKASTHNWELGGLEGFEQGIEKERTALKLLKEAHKATKRSLESKKPVRIGYHKFELKELSAWIDTFKLAVNGYDYRKRWTESLLRDGSLKP